MQVGKPGGKILESRLLHTGQNNILFGLDNLLSQMPATGPAFPIDLAKIIIEDRE